MSNLSSPSAPPSDAFFRAIIASSSDAIISKNLNGIVTSWNRAAERIFGYSEAEAVGQPITMLIPRGLLHEEELIISRIRNAEVIEHYQTTRRRKDGVLIDVSLTISPILGAEGKIIGASKIVRDISAQKCEQDKFQVTLASIGDAVISTDIQGQVIFLNKAAEDLTGWSQRDALGSPVGRVFHVISERTRQPIDSPVERVLTDGRVVELANHSILVSRDKRERPVDDSAAPIRDSRGTLIGVVLVFRDVTAQREAQLAALRLAAIIEGSDDAIVAKNLNGIVTSWNPGAERIFGYSAAEMVGESIKKLIPEERLEEEDLILARLQRGERVDHFHTVRKRKDGVYIDVALTISPIRDSDGLIIGASKIARDVTELKLAQQRLETYAAELEEKVEERTRKLRETVAELEAFSYSLSHDMRAPLRAVQSFCELVIEDYGDRIPEGVAHLRRSIAAAARLDRLITDILNLSRISQTEIEVGPVDLERLVDLLLKERDPAAGAIDVRRPLIPVIGHPALLTQCLTNLLDNAIKFVATGVVPTIQLSTETFGDRVRICVTDNGIGISAEGQVQLFGVFKRLESARGYQGTGVGLAIVRRAAERMHGIVGVQSALGLGSTFWVELSKA